MGARALFFIFLPIRHADSITAAHGEQKGLLMKKFFSFEPVRKMFVLLLCRS